MTADFFHRARRRAPVCRAASERIRALAFALVLGLTAVSVESWLIERGPEVVAACEAAVAGHDAGAPSTESAFAVAVLH